MSGHSKWAQIKRSKGAADVKKGALFSKLSKQITIAAKDGSSPDTNFKLRLAVQKARESAMPNDNIERAIKKASGADANNMHTLQYEGYGPAGTAFIVEAASDNPNRTFQNIRTIFAKNGGNIGQPGSVAWQFQTKGQILVERAENLSEIELSAIDAGADDVRESTEGLEIYTKPEDLEKIKNNITTVGAKIAQAEIIMESSQGVALNAEQTTSVQKLFDALSDDEDVVAVHTSGNL
ncbi:MAG: YebC/PmpR family DNA-binding transcriptional regulator [Patescibacteria group bacterium]